LATWSVKVILIKKIYLVLQGNHPEVEEPGLAPGDDEGEKDQHHIVRDHIVPVVFKHLQTDQLKFSLNHKISLGRKAFFNLGNEERRKEIFNLCNEEGDF
jgi:hypothetical protein